MRSIPSRRVQSVMPFVACSPDATPWPKRAPRISGSPPCAARAAGRAGSRPRASAPAPAAKPATRLRRVSVVIAAHGAALRLGDEPQCRACAASPHSSPSRWPWPASPRCAPASSPARARRATRSCAQRLRGGRRRPDLRRPVVRRDPHLVPLGPRDPDGPRAALLLHPPRRPPGDDRRLPDLGRAPRAQRPAPRPHRHATRRRSAGAAAPPATASSSRASGSSTSRARRHAPRDAPPPRRALPRRPPVPPRDLVRDRDRLQARARRSSAAARPRALGISFRLAQPGRVGIEVLRAAAASSGASRRRPPRVQDPAPAPGRARAAPRALRGPAHVHIRQHLAARLPLRSEAVSGPLSPPFIADLPLTCEALEFAVERHEGQRRDSDAAPFILHPLEVAVLLRNRGYSDEVVAAGLLHDAVEDTDATPEEIERPVRRRGSARSSRRSATTRASRTTRERKAALREQVEAAGEEAAAIYAADKVAKARELRAKLSRTPSALDEPDVQARLEHYEAVADDARARARRQRASAPAPLRAVGAADAPARRGLSAPPFLRRTAVQQPIGRSRDALVKPRHRLPNTPEESWLPALLSTGPNGPPQPTIARRPVVCALPRVSRAPACSPWASAPGSSSPPPRTPPRALRARTRSAPRPSPSSRRPPRPLRPSRPPSRARTRRPTRPRSPPPRPRTPEQPPAAPAEQPPAAPEQPPAEQPAPPPRSSPPSTTTPTPPTTPARRPPTTARCPPRTPPPRPPRREAAPPKAEERGPARSRPPRSRAASAPRATRRPPRTARRSRPLKRVDRTPDRRAAALRERRPDARQPDDVDRHPRPGQRRRPELLHRQVPDPAVPALDLPGRGRRVRRALGGPGRDQRDRDRLRPQPQRVERRRPGLDAVHALDVEGLRRRRQRRRAQGPLQPGRRDLRRGEAT